MLQASGKTELYGKYDTPDVDFYSPTPKQDIIKLSNLIKEAGIQYIYSR